MKSMVKSSIDQIIIVVGLLWRFKYWLMNGQMSPFDALQLKLSFV